MAEKKSLVEEALLQMENLQDAISNNAKGILASTMKEEISELVKESLSEEDKVEMSEMETEENVEMKEQDELDVDIEDDEEEISLDIDNEEGEESLELDMDVEGDELDDLGDDETLMSDLPMDDEEMEPLNLTMASDDEILKVFKAMGEEDGIIVKQDDNDIHLSDEDSQTEYVIQLGESEDEMMETSGEHFEEMKEGEYSEEMEEGEYSEEDDIVYEITLDEEEVEEEEEMKEGNYGGNKGDIKAGDRKKDGHYGKGPKKKETAKEEGEEDYEETKEGMIRSHSAGQYASSDSGKGLPRPHSVPNKLRLKNESLEKEVAQLREKNEEYRKALNIFREKLNEVAVFNSNLAYATRLFTEHSTTKQEKINILRRFDNVETLKESKSLYKTIKEDMSSKETSVVTESVTSKVQKSPTNGSSNNLIESKSYENPQFLRMKDLMNKIK